ncbi:hypothetical protein BJX96DRAFT_21036 [Aspergillus floccosus]
MKGLLILPVSVTLVLCTVRRESARVLHQRQRSNKLTRWQTTDILPPQAHDHVCMLINGNAPSSSAGCTEYQGEESDPRVCSRCNSSPTSHHRAERMGRSTESPTWKRAVHRMEPLRLPFSTAQY